jgi:hypothetical protein
VFPSPPHARVFRAAVDAGADATLSVVGEVLGDFVSSAEEADAKGWSGGEGEAFRPFIAAERPILDFDHFALLLLADMKAEIVTHLDFALDEG